MHNADLKISFIIASIGEARKLQETISSIEKAYDYAKNTSIEILIVFQGVDENINLRIKYPELSAFYHIKEKGLSLARNYGINKSKGDYLVFLDDDAAVKEDFLVVLSENISKIQAAAFCGKIMDPEKSSLYAECFSSSGFKFLNPFEFAYFMGSAHVLKKEILERIGLYDEKFGAGAKYPAAEESDIFFRLKSRNEAVVYLSDLVFYHPVYDVTPDSKRFNYSYASGAMLMKQICRDTKHFFIYVPIVSEIVIKSFLRSMETIFFPKLIKERNARFKYRSVFTGTLKGVWDYLWNS